LKNHYKKYRRNYDYVTLDQLLKRKLEIEEGKTFDIRNGLIVGRINP